jgi:hypothetical protein
MQDERAIVVCAFGWGQEFRLYQYHLCVKGNNYALRELTSVHPVYRQVMGIPSATLELQFGKRKLTLRGIASVEDAQKAVQYLTQWCKLPALEEKSLHVSTPGTMVQDSRQKNTDEPLSHLAFEESNAVTQDDTSFKELAQAVTAPVTTPHWEYITNIETEEPGAERAVSTRRKRQLRKEQAQFDRFLEEDTLPTVAVPVRLQPGERAHYSTGATLCGERIGESVRYTYPALDHGTLILTNRRMIYIGRRSQIVMDYRHFLHISRLRGAVAFEADHWNKRVIFEVRDPLECTMYTKCILQRFQQEILITASGEERISRGDDRHIDGIMEQRVW